MFVVNEQNQVEYRAVEVGQVQDGLREVNRYREITEPGQDGADTTRQVEVLRARRTGSSSRVCSECDRERSLTRSRSTC